MNVYHCNVWDFIGEVSAICITTNGYVTSSGKNIMGAGIAREAKRRYPNIDFSLGKKLTKYGNHVMLLTIEKGTSIFSFPTKRDSFDFSFQENFPGFANEGLKNKMIGCSKIPGWAIKSEIELIKRSANELMDICNLYKLESVLLPKPGCSHGGLKWENVSPVLDKILDHSKIFIVESKEIVDRERIMKTIEGLIY